MWRQSAKRSRKKMCRPICMLLAFLCIFLIAVLIVQMIVPELIGCLQILLEELPGVLDNIVVWMEDNLQISAFLSAENNMFQGSETDWQETFTKVINILLNGLGGVMGAATSIISSVFSTVVTLTVGLVFAIYLLVGKERLGGQFRRLFVRYLPEKMTKNFTMLWTFWTSRFTVLSWVSVPRLSFSDCSAWAVCCFCGCHTLR